MNFVAHQAEENECVRPPKLANDSVLAVEAHSDDDDCHSGEVPNDREDSMPHGGIAVTRMHDEGCAVMILVMYVERCVVIENAM